MAHFKVGLVMIAVVIGMQLGIHPVAAQSSDSSVAEGKKVVIEFAISLPESNEKIPGNVAEYVQGKKQVIPALEEALIGLKPGESKRIELTADQAFGPY
ncbi:MAG: FKBP-type peptidyl-prolyl cis-trans isomerase, partial [Nitrospiraceae bacterium]